MKIFSGPLSMFGAKVEIAAHEKAIDFELVMVPFDPARGYDPKHPDVLRINPKRQVPVLIDGELTLFDSTLIFEYLEDAYPRPALYPAGAAARARCRRLELTGDEILLPPVRSLMYRTEPPAADPDRRRMQQEAAARAEADLRGHYGQLERELGEAPYFCGEFSVADIALFMSLFFAQRLRGPELSGNPALVRWFERMRARPAVSLVVGELMAADRELSPALYAPSS